MTSTEINVASLDHDTLKQSLINFIAATGNFDDFDYEGSAINTLIDTLTRNTQYDSFLANMLANESFIQSAQLRANVVSHAQKLSYTPRSCSSARATVDVTITPAETVGLASTLEMPAGTTFLASMNGETYYFVTNQLYTMTLNVSNEYVVEDVELYQGQRITNTFIHTTNDPHNIPNERIDTSTLSIYSIESGIQYTFTEATSIIDTTLYEDFYFISENYLGLYQIDFGKDLIGREPTNNSAINVTYINCEDAHANGASTFIAGSSISGYSNIAVSTVQAAYGGDEKEDIEEIRFLAPRAYQVQDRAVIATDYQTLVKNEYPFISSVKVWGGEDNDPPEWGKVFLSVISDDGNALTTTIKNDITDYLKDYNVGSITPEFVTAEEINLDLDINFAYDNKLTSSTFNELSSSIRTIVESYNTTELLDFGNFYNDSKLTNNIFTVKGIKTVDIEKTAYINFDVLRYTDPTYIIDFDNPIVPGSLVMTDFEVDINSIQHQLYDDESGNVVLSYLTGEVLTTETVGTIDYDTGEIEIILNMIQDASTAKMTVTPLNENFFAYNNKYLNIDEIEFTQITLG